MPYIYTSFVSTIDGKIFVKKDGYWPIGSRQDYERFTYLRAQADIIIDGKNTAIAFAGRTIETIHSDFFLKKRTSRKKIEYGIITSKPDQELTKRLKNSFSFKPKIFTSQSSLIFKPLLKVAEVIKLDEAIFLNIEQFVLYLEELGYKKIFIDGGPKLIASLLEKSLINKLYITIAPKIFGTENGVTMTMVEGKLFLPADIKLWKLFAAEKVDNEVFLEYERQ